MTPRLILLAAFVLVASLAACSGSETSQATTAAPPTAVPTTAGLTSAAEEPPTSKVEPFPAGEPIDLVYLCDSGGQDV
ncbi:MAG: hypothetical protein QNJ89_08980, partial [Acidimicrobiia bacterium]|nr:hypothetical protein [Acidimicrobiia bacterium]